MPMGLIGRRQALARLAGGMLAGKAAQSQTPLRGGTLTVGLSNDAKTYDPISSVQYTERYVLYLAFDTLVKYGPDFSIEPELAESWDTSADGRRIVFTLRQGVKFQDGTPFDAAAVKWNIDQRLDEKVNSPQRQVLAPIVASVDVDDPQHVAFNLVAPSPVLFSLLGERPGFMVSPTAWQQRGSAFGSQPVGTGAFVLKEWTRGSRVVLERNPTYWQPGLPYLDRIVVQDLAGSVIGVQRLLTGEIDYVDQLTPADILPIEKRAGIVLKPIKVGRWYFLQWHVNEPPFDNPKLRQAFAHAIDRNRLNEITMRGQGTVSNGPTPERLWWYDPDLKFYPHDPTRAKALLAEAGHANGFEYVLSTPQVTVFQQINQLLQEQLGAVGIRLQLQPVAASEWYARVVSGTTNLTPTRWTQRADPDGLLYILFHSKGFANTMRYRSERVDGLLDRARTTYDASTRKKLYAEAQQQIVDDLPMVPLIFGAEYAALRASLNGFEWIPDEIPRFRDIWKAVS
ncbi:MAG TPA: ABC transporter substrate-binding protein [Acetobacteraceae bacterium]|nr:ABC transporter substrate-binding protein [Acetobacteraceae bacterium]